MSKPLSQSTTFQSLVTRVTALENEPEGAFIFEASGTGSDQSADLNSLISSTAASGKYCIISGTFFAGSPIVIPSGAKILGIGKATIIAHPNLPLNSPLVVPSSYSSGTDNYSQSDVRIIGVTFDGANRAGTDFLIKLYSVDGLTFEDCRFRNYQYGLLALGGCRNISLNSLSFSNWGKPDVSIEGGPALWIAGNLVSGDNTPSRGVRAFDLDFRNSEWVAIYLFARDFSFIGGTIDNVKEGGFYGQGLNHAGSSSPADSVSSNGEITGYRISNIIRKYIASSGIEIGGSGLSIHHNTIFNCEDAGIKLNWPVAGALVESNDVYDTVKAAGSYNTYATYGQITVIQIDGSLVQDVTIRGYAEDGELTVSEIAVPCKAQVDSATEAMRSAQGFSDTDRRIIILSATLNGIVNTDDEIVIDEGAYAGARFAIASVGRDPASAYFDCRGRVTS